MDIQSIDDRARRLRLTRADIAKRAGLDPSTVTRVLNGAVDPRLSTLESMAKVLDDAEAEMRAELGGVTS